jgi:hypothetical protein
MKILHKRALTVGFAVVLAASILLFGCVQNHGSGSDQTEKTDSGRGCSEKCTGNESADCCKQCCSGNYVWTPESCVCRQ